MASKVQRMMKTAGCILREQGPSALLAAIRRRLGANATASGAAVGKPTLDESNIAFALLNRDDEPGVMIDVGAHYGGALEKFANARWQVYAFEPDSDNRAHLEGSFGGAPNVRIDPHAVSDEERVHVPLYRSEESTGISGLSAFHPTHRRSGTVDTTTLTRFVEDHAIEHVDFLKIDTEGFDLFVLKGFPWQRLQPRLILCEFEDRKTLSLGYSYHDLAGYLLAEGYRVLVSEWYPIERYGIPHRWRRFRPYPVELADPQAWGNLLAVSNAADHQRLLQICEQTLD
jgi:FkbM family methyltransferase